MLKPILAESRTWRQETRQLLKIMRLQAIFHDANGFEFWERWTRL